MRPVVPHRRGAAGLLVWSLLPALAMPVPASWAQDPPRAPEGADEAGNPNYCANIASAAADARYRWQTETLTALGKEIEGRIARLEAKRVEYEEWLRRRQEFLAKASESVVAIYARMKPEAAAQQLASMGPEAAAAILVRVDARIASAILNEMEPARAALLANTITETPKADTPKPDPSKPDLPKMPPPPAGSGVSPNPRSGEKTG